MSRENLEARAEKTLRDTDTYRVPVAIDVVARRLNLTMEAAALGENVSGMLVCKGGQVRSDTTRPTRVFGSGLPSLMRSHTICCLPRRVKRRSYSLIVT